MHDVSLWTQPNDKDCSLASAKMLYDYKNIPFPYQSISQELDRDEKGRVWPFDLARSLAKHTEVDIHIKAFNHLLFDKTLNNESDEEKKDRFKQDPLTKDLASYVEYGGTIEIDLVRRYFLHNLLGNHPFLALVNAPDYRVKKYETKRKHFIVVKGVKNQKYHLLDPHPHKRLGGEKTVEEYQFITSLVRTKVPAVMWIE